MSCLNDYAVSVRFQYFKMTYFQMMAPGVSRDYSLSNCNLFEKYEKTMYGKGSILLSYIIEKEKGQLKFYHKKLP